MMPVETREITIPAGTMLNCAPHEDSDWIVLEEDVMAVIDGEIADSAQPVIIPSLDKDVVWYYHQPEKSG